MLAENHRHIGKLSKLQGFEGEALILSDSGFPKKIEKTEWVFLLIDGLPVPFFVSSFILRNENSAVIKLEDINTAEEMEELIGLEVCVEESKRRKSSTFSFSVDIKDYRVINTKKEILGIVKSVINYKDNYLLQVLQGNREILIPFNENIVVKIDDLSNTVFVNPPDGLLDLNK